jgi:hypothetical protein
MTKQKNTLKNLNKKLAVMETKMDQEQEGINMDDVLGAGKQATPEQILKHWGEVNYWVEAHLLLLSPKGCEIELWKGGDSEFGDSEFGQYGEHEEFVPNQKHVTIIAGRIAEGYVPIGVVGVDLLHPHRERRAQLGYLPTAEAERLMTVWRFGYIAGLRLASERSQEAA